MSTTALTIITTAFQILGVYMPGEAPSGPDGDSGFTFLNLMLGSWAQRRCLVPMITRERFDLVADSGSPTVPYTIGSGGDFDTARPPNQNSVVSANLILTEPDPEVRVSLGIFTDDAYTALAVPALSGEQPTGLYYSQTYATDLGSIYLWPVPDNATNDLELFLQKAIAQFTDLTTVTYLPDGVELALTYNLADMLQTPYGRELSASASRIAVNSLGVIKRSNTHLSDLANDAMFANARAPYNIQSGTGG